MLTVCLNFMWLLVLTIVGYALVTAVWRAQRSFRWPGKVHSLGLLQRSGQSPKVRCTVCNWSVVGKVHLPRPRAKVVL